ISISASSKGPDYRSDNPRKVVRIINAHLEPSAFGETIRDQQVKLVKGCLSEKGVYAALGFGSTCPISGERVFSELEVVGHMNGGCEEKGKGKPEEREKEKERIKEEIEVLRKVWARGPVHLESPYEVMLHSPTIDGVGLGVGIVHRVRVR